LLPVAAYVRSNGLRDSHLAEVALRGLAEFLGLDIVVTDAAPDLRLEDIQREYLALLGKLARDPAPDIRAAVPDAAYGVARGAMQVLTEMYAREAGGPRNSPGR